MAKKSVAEAARARLAESKVAAAAEVELAAAPVAERRSAIEVPIESVAPNVRNVRRDPAGVDGLVASISDLGLLQRLLIRPVRKEEAAQYPEGVRYVVIAGENRLRALRQLGWAEVPVEVRTSIDDVDERLAMLHENIARHGLTPIDEALAYQELVDGGMSQREVARRSPGGVSQAHISRRLALLRLPEQLQELVSAGRLLAEGAVLVTQTPEPVQAEAAGMLMTAKDEVLDSAVVRRVLSAAEGEVKARERAEVLQAEAAAAGATFLPDSPVGYWRKEVEDPAEVGDARERGELAACEGWDGRLVLLDLGKADPEPVGDVESGPVFDQARWWKSLCGAMGKWADEAAVVPVRQAQLLVPFAQWIVRRVPFDTGWLVCKLVSGRVGAKVESRDGYASWLESLSPKDQVSVAWWVLVVGDLEWCRSGKPTSSEGLERWDQTSLRLGEVGVDMEQLLAEAVR